MYILLCGPERVGRKMNRIIIKMSIGSLKFFSNFKYLHDLEISLSPPQNS
jgi:hypothetical protein